MRYHIVLLLACGSPVLGFVSQMRHGGPRPANRASPACLLVFLCLLLLVFRFARRSAWAVFRECLFLFFFCDCSFCVCSTGTATRSDPQSRRARANYTFRCGIRYFI